MMKIINSYPPNIDSIDDRFAIRGKPIIFTYGDIIYNPLGIIISPSLHAHETIHSIRQTIELKNILAWWDRYLIDDEFRLNEELLAHKAEYKQFCSENKDRNRQSIFLNTIATRLASAMYGNMISSTKARKIITGK